MRSHGMQNEIFKKLEERGSSLRDTHFVEVHNVPDHIYTSFFAADLRKLDTSMHPYNFWKGRVCKTIGAGILIDDMEGTDVSLAGCQQEGIEVIHPDALLSFVKKSSPHLLRQCAGYNG